LHVVAVGSDLKRSYDAGFAQALETIASPRLSCPLLRTFAFSLGYQGGFRGIYTLRVTGGFTSSASDFRLEVAMAEYWLTANAVLFSPGIGMRASRANETDVFDKNFKNRLLMNLLNV